MNCPLSAAFKTANSMKMALENQRKANTPLYGTLFPQPAKESE
jgi:hypothetical protein